MREAGGQADRRSGAVPRPPYNSFPFLPPSQGGGWRRDGPGRAPAGRRRHILPHRLPGLHGERAARPLPCLPALGAGTPGAPVGARAGPRSRLMALPGSQAVVALTVPTRGPGCLGPGGEPRGTGLWSRRWPAGAFLRELLLQSPQRRGFHPPWTDCYWQTVRRMRGWVGHGPR